MSMPCLSANLAIRGIVIGAKGTTVNNPKLRSLSNLLSCLFAELIASSEALP